MAAPGLHSDTERLVHTVMRMRPAAMPADIPAEMPTAVAVGMAMTMAVPMSAADQHDVWGRIHHRFERQG